MTRIPSSLIALLILCIGSPLFLYGEKKKTDNDKLIEDVAAHVNYLASDELEGRGVETDGINKAADYIVQHFKSIGLKVDSYNGNAFQPFEIATDVRMGDESENYLTIIPPANTETKELAIERSELALGFEFNPLAIGATGSFEAGAVFVGYGIEAPDLQYDEYVNLDVKGKVVVIVRKEPQQDDPNSVFDGTKASRHATFQSKVSNAYQKGAAAVIMVNDAGQPGKYLSGLKHALSQYSAQLKALTNEFQELVNPNAEEIAQHKRALAQASNNISITVSELNGDGDAVLEFDEAGAPANRKSMPVFFARRSAIEPMIQFSFGKTLEEIEKIIDEKMVPITGELKGWRIQGSASLIQEKAKVKNVVGVLEGKGALKDETVVVGAHYDHLGYGGRGSLAPWTMDIHNGADDNSSGTTGMLEIASIIAKSEAKNRRRVVFIAFSAEERGLIGSNFYVNNPLFSLENTVAMINLDMIGRLTDNKLIVTGTGTSDVWPNLLDELNRKAKFEITRQPEGTGPSDHQSFYMKDIPVLHLFTGLHEFYHRPNDDPEIVDFEGMARIIHLGAQITRHVQTMEQRPNFKKAEKQRNVADTGGDRPYFGSIPDYADNVDGLPLSGVSTNGPAALAGIKPKDVIVKVNDYKIGGIEDFDNALRKFKGGAKVNVTLMRGGKKLEVEVKLGAPR
tara:strand:- start:702 stop:2744 length:2043 start_codon:yes stop_codon:yes gene_type:complete